MTREVEDARAKVNLALHVTGRRDDGYHLIDTLVVFPPVADRLVATPDDGLSLVIEGPEAAALAGEDPAGNLVMRAARGLADICGGRPGARIRLEKALPVAAGIGGGSADAAAALRLLCRLWSVDPALPAVRALALRLGADVPMCLLSRPLRARGIGERTEAFAPAEGIGILLANPRIAVPTGPVFARLEQRDNAPVAAMPPGDRDGFLAALLACRNDLEAPARAVAPGIGEALERIAGLAGCRLARMSGSGATCFGLFDDEAAARAAAARLSADRPDWWIAAAPLS